MVDVADDRHGCFSRRPGLFGVDQVCNLQRQSERGFEVLGLWKLSDMGLFSVPGNCCTPSKHSGCTAAASWSRPGWERHSGPGLRIAPTPLPSRPAEEGVVVATETRG